MILNFIEEKNIMKHFYQKIEGWFDFQNLYTEMVQKHKDDSHFVEVGVFKGKSLAYLAVEIINSGKKIKLDAVDTWLGSPMESIQQAHPEVIAGTLYDSFLNNIEPIKNYINIIRKDSVETAMLYEDNSLDFVYIDASHHYEFIKSDIQAWYPKIKIGGYIGGHDYVPPNAKPHGIFGVYHAVNEFFPNNFSVVDQVSWIHEKC
jgi:cephalosporin hydroxylase